jgi:ssDNA-binding Zn-finger/Zn-ribbon topoisomerase 1
MSDDPEPMETYVDCSNPQCGISFPIDAEQEGTKAPCPSCGQRTEVPWSMRVDDESPPDAISAVIDTRSAAKRPPEKVHCPSCNIIMAATDVVCVACGYHRQKGKRLGTVRVRKAEAAIRLGMNPVGAAVALMFGSFMLLLAAVSLVMWRPLPAIAFFLMGVPLIPLGVLFAGIIVANVTVSKEPSGRICCAIVYGLFTYPFKERRVFLTKEDRLVICHDVPAIALVFVLALLCTGIVPGILWLMILLSKRTNLEIRKTATDQVEHFSLLWGERGTQELIDVIREVEHLSIDRK